MSNNRLASAHSAYLRQHAENPVDWWEWSEAAFAEARRRDVPIFLSVGYAACHWCHVMAHESFEDDTIARYMNEHFVAVKVDREERPDVDAIYMAATQAVSGHGGWPMSVFLQPDGQPFMAGTYYPPVDRGGQPGFLRLLQAMNDGWVNQRELIVRQAAEISRAIEQELNVLDRLAPAADALDLDAARTQLAEQLVASCDEFGGFSRAPKFPRPSYVAALLHSLDDPPTRWAATRTLDAMSRRGMYDHLRGGFARYSVDAQWHVPHFEKMLSDQALLAMAYLQADRAFGGGTPWRAVAVDTLNFVLTDLALPRGYASSLDADSDGHEGLHATWTPEEVEAALTAKGLAGDTEAIIHRYELHGERRFEGRYIPQLAPGVPFVAPLNLAPAIEALRGARAQRVQPGRDEKVILEWNAMLAVSLFQANDATFAEAAQALLNNLSETHFGDGEWYRTDGLTSLATSADVAWLTQAYVRAFEYSGHDADLDRAAQCGRYLLANYWDGDLPTEVEPQLGQGVVTSHRHQRDVAYQARDIFDGATPSGYAASTKALAQLASLTGDAAFGVAADRMIDLAHTLLSSHPTAVPDLLDAASTRRAGIEIVIPGDSPELLHVAREQFAPFGLIVTGTGGSPLLRDRTPGYAYVCRNNTCQLPVNTPEGLVSQLASMQAKGAL